jgi:hypothetical protein
LQSSSMKSIQNLRLHINYFLKLIKSLMCSSTSKILIACSFVPETIITNFRTAWVGVSGPKLYRICICTQAPASFSWGVKP